MTSTTDPAGRAAAGGARQRLAVTAKRSEADGVVSLRLADPDGARLPDWTPGAHIDVLLPNRMTRQYSLCGDRWDPYSYRVGVLREPAGRGASAFVHDELRVGDHLGWGGPRNDFPLVPSGGYLFVAGGIGITPLLPMLRQAEMLGAEWRLLYGGRRRTAMAFLGELTRYGERVVVAPQDETGLLDLPAFLGPPRPGVRVYGCGPAPLLAALGHLCAVWPAYTLRTELFAGDPVAPAARRAPFEVRLARRGIAVTVDPGVTVIDALGAVGVEVLSSCRRGTCGTCETPVLAGRPDHRDSVLDDDDRAAGDCMLVCVSGSLDDRLVLDL